MSQLPKTYQPLQTYHLSHDLRGPLNSMLGFTELLLEGIEGPLTDIQHEDITAIRQSAQTLLRLINTVVDLGKIEAGVLKLNVNPMSLKHAIEAKLRQITGFGSGEVAFSINLPDNLPSVLADHDHVDQIIGSLLEYLLTKKATNLIIISAQLVANQVEVTIAAPNITLTLEQLEQLFQLTVETDAVGHSKLTEGGLFLPLAHQLARQHRGRLSAGSGQNGLWFQLLLPVYQTE